MTSINRLREKRMKKGVDKELKGKSEAVKKDYSYKVKDKVRSNL